MSTPESGARSGGRERPTFSDTGIVLRSHKLGESDKIMRILTRLHGMRSAVARGIRKTTSRFGARLEPFTCVRLQIHRGRTLDTVTQAEIETSFKKLREDLGLFAHASAMAELAGNLAQEHEPNPELYDLLLQGFTALEARPQLADSIFAGFASNAMARAGFELMITSCSNCGSPLPAGETSLSLHLGGLVCDRCRSAGTGRLGRTLRVNRGTRELLERLASDPFGGEPRTGERASLEAREARMIMERVVEHWLEKESRSAAVMRGLGKDAT